jgi:hypothetical protein
MKFGNRTVIFGAAVAACAILAAPARADELERTRAALQGLKERLERIEAEREAQRRVAAAAAVEAGARPRSWKLPGTNTSMQVGGFVFFHMLWEFSGANAGSTSASTNARGEVNPAAFANPASASDNAFNGGDFKLRGNYSRFFISTWTPTDWGELRTYIETDFFGGAGSPLRLRHAWGALGPIQAGQTDSTFRNSFAEGDTLNPGLAVNTPASRVPLIRYSHNFGAGLVFTIGVEDPADTILHINCSGTANCATNTVAIAAAQRWPEVVGSLDYVASWGRIKVAGLVKQLEADTGGGSNSGADQAFGWGISAGALWNVTPAILVAGTGFVGEGIGRQSGGSGFSDAIFLRRPATVGGDLRAIWTMGGQIWAQWKITNTVRVNGIYSYAIAEAEDELRGTKGQRKAALAGVNHYVWMALANLIWAPVPQVEFGIEYAYTYASRFHVGQNPYSSAITGSARYRF